MQYPSSVSPGSETKYTCVVADGAVAGAAGPLFLVVAADAPGQQWLAQSPQAVWQQIHTQVGRSLRAILADAVPFTGCPCKGLQHLLWRTLAFMLGDTCYSDVCCRSRVPTLPTSYL